MSCVFSWQIWFNVFQRLDLATMAPQPSTDGFPSWSCRVVKEVSMRAEKDLIPLLSWWLEDDCAFHGANPGIMMALHAITNEAMNAFCGVQLVRKAFRMCLKCRFKEGNIFFIVLCLLQACSKPSRWQCFC